MIFPPYGDGKVQKAHPAPLVAYPEGDEAAKETVYCFNMNRSIPDERASLDGPFDVDNPRTGHELRYEKHYGEPLTAYADKARKNDDQDILDVLKNGFPNNASKLRESLGLTDLEFQYATQLAVWYYSDSDNGTYLYEATDGSEKINEAYKVLTKQKNSPVQLVSADPKVETLEIYKVAKPKGSDFNYQNLLGARFVNPLDGKPIEPDPIQPEPVPSPKKDILKIRFSKLGDNDLSTELKGAQLAVYEGEYPQNVPDEARLVETWTSGNAKDLSIKAGIYTYVEQKVPEGYDKAANIVFKVEGQKLYLKDGVGWKDSSLYASEKAQELTAYNDFTDDSVSWGTTPYGKFYYVDRVVNESSVAGDEVIYCFNINLKQPTNSMDYGVSVDPDIATLKAAPKFTAQYGNSSLIAFANKPKITDPERFADSIGRVIYAGYPNNGAGLKENLSDTAFRAVTQMAIYYFADSFGLEEIEAAKDEQAAHGFKGILDPKNESIKSAYKKLIEYAEGDAKVPEDTKIPIYKPSINGYQNFIGTLTNPQALIPLVQMIDKKSELKPAPKLDVTFSKVAAGQGNELAGATLTVTGGDDFSEEWVSTGVAKVLTLVAGEYTLTEKSAPEGYEIASAIEFRVTADKKLEIKDSASGKYVAADEAKVQMVDELKPAPKLDVTFSKVAAGQGNELAGATLTVTGGDDFSEEWVSTGVAKVLTLVAGEYTLTEKSAPEGYEIASAIEFRVTADKKLEIKDSASGKYVAADEAKVQMVDELKPAPKLDVTFSKVAAGQGNELAGATLTVTGGDDFSEEWVSTGVAKVLTLVAGEYTLTEKSAPEGYEIASAIEFRVTADKKLEIKDSASGKYVAADEAKVQMVDELKPAPKLDVTFSKVAAGQGNELAGATLTVTGGDDFSEEWVSTGVAKVLTLVAGEYTLTEKSAPEGYEIASAIEFRVTADKKLEIKDSASGKYVAADEAKVQMVDELKPAPKLDVTFSKVAAGQGNELAGATLTVTGGDDFSEEWVSTGVAKVLTLVAGEYTLTEKSAPEGYEIASAIEFRVTADKKLEIKDSASGKYVAADEAKVQMVDELKPAPKLDVTFSKVAAGQGNELAGATLTVTGGDDFSEEWVSTGVAKVLTLVAGEYTLTEKSAPEGYEIASAIEFRVTADKKLEIKDSASGKYVAADEAKVQMVDELKPAPKLDVTFSKVAAGQGNELAGATLTVTGGDDFSEEWVSTGVAKVLTLVAGEYTLTEKSAPEGYEIASAIEFRVTADKKLEIKDSASGKYVAADEAKVQMVDELKPAPKLDVTFSKVAAGQGNELAGATLTVTGGDDFSEEWVSTGVAKVLTLVAGEYTLTEKSAPEGYEIASAIEFRVTADKKLEIKDSASGKYVAADEAKVQMVDELKPAPKLDVTFSKVAAGQGNELAGATLTVTGGDDFSEEWVSTGVAKVLTLVAGEYTLTEKSAPEGYEIASAIEFRVTADKKLEIKDSASGKYVAADEAKVQMVDELKPAPKLDVTFSKVAAGQGNELAGATLTVTGGDDFSEEWVSTGVAKVLTLVAGEYTLTEKSAPEGYEIASAIEFRVTADKKLEIKDSASGKYVAADEAKVQMVDELKPAPAPTPSEVPTPNDESSVPATPAPTSETSNTPEKHDVLAWTGANIAGLSAVTAMLLAAGALLLRRKKA
ncbi:thioester-forming surface-anchored protein [Trueperella pecoris]|uniref:Thioester-forming surface-anchored protein n=2 Tax=Trueperella pecoris TaxID=2733571 RepID=A0A7M1QVI8_9ACTO|nr:SpaA isopeptide-forming pilin-related protein [Trueperella pecoris]QOR45345.1 thioester-forming surface-anchored protein [Trueperella pecoris]